MFVDEVVELVLPPFPPLPKLSARTAVPGTRSYGSVEAATRAASRSAMLARAKTMPPRARVDLTSPPSPTRAWKWVRKGGIWSKKERANPAGFYSKALQLALASRLINQSRTANGGQDGGVPLRLSARTAGGGAGSPAPALASHLDRRRRALDLSARLGCDHERPRREALQPPEQFLRAALGS